MLWHGKPANLNQANGKPGKALESLESLESWKAVEASPGPESQEKSRLESGKLESCGKPGKLKLLIKPDVLTLMEPKAKVYNKFTVLISCISSIRHI